MSCIVLGGPEDHTQVQQFVRRTQKTQHVLILMAMIYYSEGTQAKAAKGKMAVSFSTQKGKRSRSLHSQAPSMGSQGNVQ